MLLHVTNMGNLLINYYSSPHKILFYFIIALVLPTIDGVDWRIESLLLHMAKTLRKKTR